MSSPPAPAPTPRRRWFRRAPEAVATSTVCVRCGQAGKVKLLPGEACASCKSLAAWAEFGDAPLKIDAAAIDQAMVRRAGEAAGVHPLRRMAAWLPLGLSVALAGAAAWSLYAMFAPRELGPLRQLIADIQGSYRRATLLGLVALVVGVWSLVRLRRHRNYRRGALVAAHALAAIAGLAAGVVGGVHWAWSGASGGVYTSMPPREALPVATSTERILSATAVVLAPDGDGDARGLALGTGAIVATDAHRAWIVTCSHVAIPYVSVGSVRDPRKAHPVWVQLSDGREGRARVRWAAPPPLDVVLIELPMDNPPPPVEIAPLSQLAPGDRVTFVPNPYRAGWLVHEGQLLRRERHDTPAGAYDLLFTDLPVIPGDSGSGLFDARGRLVGLNTWTRRGGGGAAEGISLPSETLRALVDAIAADRLDDLAANPLGPGPMEKP